MQTVKKAVFFALAISLILGSTVVLSSCEKKQPPDRYATASQMITNGQYDQAIALLTDALQVNPEDKRSRLLLASAYAGQAGILLSGYMQLAVEILRETKTNEIQNMSDLYNSLRDNASPAEQQVIDVVETLSKTTIRLASIVREFRALPTLHTDLDRDNLHTAISLLDAGNYEGGPALYRGLLRLVEVKDHLHEFSGLKKCNVDFNSLLLQLTVLQESLGAVYNDFVLGTIEPTRRQTMLDAANSFNQDVTDAISALRAANKSGLVDLSKIYRKANSQCE